MELYTGFISPNGKRVRIAAAEIGAALDLKMVNFLQGENRSPEYMARNPMGKVPTLVDGDLVLWESPAIVLYLAEKHGGPLWPEAPGARADLLRWMFFGASHLDPYFTTLVMERLIKPRRGEPPAPELAASAELWLARFMPVVEQALSGREHVTGAFSLADVTLGCTIELSPMVGYDLGPYPAVRAWIERLQARPSWRAGSTGQIKPEGGGPTRERFVNAYDGGTPPPWDIGGPQRDLVAVFDELSITGSVLDLGCGTGENVLELARRGLDVTGLDSTPAAIAAAEKKREERGLSAKLVLGDALDLAPLGRTFDTVVDCGLFHVLAEDERHTYLRELPKVLRPGGRHLMLGFAMNTGPGPRGYTAEELRSYFSAGYREVFVRKTSFQANGMPRDLGAWLSLFVREG